MDTLVARTSQQSETHTSAPKNPLNMKEIVNVLS
jgi:hypothetical protein